MFWLIPLGAIILFTPYKSASGKTTSIGFRIIDGMIGQGEGALPPMQSSIDTVALQIAKSNLILREGRRNTAYLDSEGKLTVGVGHLVTFYDGIKLGQTISDARVDAFFAADIMKAFSAAKAQAKELNKYTPDFIGALTSVNFQLGTGWKYNFKLAYAALKDGDVPRAIDEIYDSRWANQTPTRVADFAAAIQTSFA